MEDAPLNKNTPEQIDSKDPRFPVAFAQESYNYQVFKGSLQHKEAIEHEKKLGFNTLSIGKSMRNPETGVNVTNTRNYVEEGTLGFTDSRDFLGYNTISHKPQFTQSGVPDNFGLLEMIGDVQSMTTPFKPNDPYLIYQQQKIGSIHFFV